jgi:hypothetical protein
MSNKKIDIDSLHSSDIYTTISEAKEEIWKRWNDKKLRKKVEEFLDGDIPDIFRDGPKATLARQIMSPNFEFFYFLESAEILMLDIALLEFPRDRFVAANNIKYHLAKFSLDDGIGRNGGSKITNIKIIDFDCFEGKKLCEIKTLWDESFVDFHHRILNSTTTDLANKIYDISEWYERKGGKAENFYLYYLALFICHGVLFENYLMNKEEESFTTEKVLPTIRKLEEIFGIKPLIVPVSYFADETHSHWQHYPGSIRKMIDKI